MYNIIGLAVTIEWAVVPVFTVASVSWGYFFISYIFIVSFDNTQEIFGATVTNFDSISVKYLVEFVRFREVYI